MFAGKVGSFFDGSGGLEKIRWKEFKGLSESLD
jgi:hypothetical protein